MKVYMKSVNMIAWFTDKGIITPIRFQKKNDEKEMVTIKIDNIVLVDEEKLAGNKMLIYRCQSQANGEVRLFELKYEVQTCKWFLWKM